MTDPELAALERAVAANGGDHVARHNLGVALRRRDRSADALATIEEALRRGAAAPETAMMRAHLLGDLGRFDAAIDQYRATLAAAPGLVEAHEALALLLPQVGRRAEALDSYRVALGRAPEIGMLWVSALRMAGALGDHAQALTLAGAAAERFGHDSLIGVPAAGALAGLGRLDEADALLHDILRGEPDNVGALLTHAQVAVRCGDLDLAEARALAATRCDPAGQGGWALLTVIWRLREDAREHWLADYDRLVMPIDLPRFDGWNAVRGVLDALHLTRDHPGDQSLRGGTQTRGSLFDRRDPVIQGLAATIRAAVEARLAVLPADPSHPFLGRNSGRVRYAGSWSVRLRSEGFHVSHIHQSGWLSSACYIALPDEVAGSAAAGALAFGVPDARLGLDLPARRIVPAREGQLVIFPSYLFHGTLPFVSITPRLTVAFDALPVDFAGAAL